MKYESFSLRYGLTKLYTSTSELPMSKWNRIHETDNVAYLIKRGTATRGTLRKAWDRIQNEYVSKFGISEEYKEYARLQLKHIKLSAQYYQTMDRDIDAQLNLIEVDISDKEQKFNESITFKESYGWLIKRIGIYLPLNTITVDDYYSIYQSEIKQAANG